MRDRPYTVQIYMRGGQTITVRCSNFKVEEDGVVGLKRISIENGKPTLRHINLGDVTAILYDEEAPRY